LPCHVSVVDYDTDILVGDEACIAEPNACVDMCDPSRLSASGWGLVNSTRGGAADCFWTPTDEGEHILDIPTVLPSRESTHCYTQFAFEGTLSGLTLETRHGSSPWTTQQKWGPSSSAAELQTFIFDNNVQISSRGLAEFRLVFPSGPVGSNIIIKVFEPMTVCRKGPL